MSASLPWKRAITITIPVDARALRLMLAAAREYAGKAWSGSASLEHSETTSVWFSPVLASILRSLMVDSGEASRTL
jgi:hypothetical protein